MVEKERIKTDVDEVDETKWVKLMKTWMCSGEVEGCGERKGERKRWK